MFCSAKVLQRSNPSVPPLSFVSLKFELAFNLAVIWMIVFVALGKGTVCIPPSNLIVSLSLFIVTWEAKPHDANADLCLGYVCSPFWVM